jgi:hypothetical protein
MSYADVFQLELDRSHHEDICPGDMVRTGQNRFPHYAVIAVDGDKVWVRNVQNGKDDIAPLARVRKIAA